ncbi:MAG: glycosyltransferase family 39 protein [Anaerolineae bacterium]|nr:glycosyltransferase family 39 protein [Anaerolineae bacterium]
MSTFERFVTILILGIFLIFATVYALNNPPFEGPDEVGHYAHAELLTRMSAPVPPDIQTPLVGQYHHPPLYYWLTSLLVRGADNSQLDVMGSRYNPFYRGNYTALIGAVGGDNNNLFLHRADERFPDVTNPIANALYRIRMLSVALGFATLVGCVFIFRVIFPKSGTLRLLALGSVAFWAQFNYITSVMNNDNLATFGATFAILMMLYILRDKPNWRNTAFLGVFAGIAILSKANTLILAVPIGLTLLIIRAHLKYWAWILVITFVIGGWWYANNLIQYGDPTALSAVPNIPGAQPINPDGSFSLDVALRNGVFIYETFWARFGGGIVAVGDELYTYFNILTVISLVGCGIWVIRAIISKKPLFPTELARNIGIVLGIFTVTMVGAVFYLSGKYWGGNLGRYLIPLIGVWGSIMALGIAGWIPRQWRYRALILLFVMGGVGTSALFRYFIPAYQPAPIPEIIDRPVYYRFGDVAELIGISPIFPRALPDEKIQVTLYWRALRPTDDQLRVALHSAQTDVVRRDSYPAAGNLLASDWVAGQEWAETYWIYIPEDAPTQISDILIVKLYDGDTLAELPIIGRDETPVTVANIGAIAINAPPTNTTIAYRLADKIGLAQPTTSIEENSVEICLTWSALQFPEGNYNLFVHILSPSGGLIEQYDAAPMNNRYPTGGWREGEQINECVMMSLEKLTTDDFIVGIGMVDAVTFARLRMTDTNGGHITNDILLIPMRR